MPELPEVETVRRGLAPVMEGRRITSATAHDSPKFNTAPDAVGATLTTLDRRGKYLVGTLDDGRRLVIHLGMTGQLRVDVDPGPYARATWTLDDDHTVVFRDVRRFGRIAVVGDDLSGLPTFAALGPEPFDPAFTGEHLWQALARSRTRVKTQLLAQRVVAGVGNIYADEALWRARVHPGARTVSRPKAERLRDAIVEVLAQGVAAGGTTLRDYRTVSGAEGSNQHQLDCYGRAGEPCRRCGTTLRRAVVDARGTTFCPACQRR